MTNKQLKNTQHHLSSKNYQKKKKKKGKKTKTQGMSLDTITGMDTIKRSDDAKC